MDEFNFEEVEATEPKEDKKSIKVFSLLVNWENIPFYLILGLAALLPVWVLPFGGFSLGFSKAILLNIVLLATIVFYLINVLQKGTVSVPKSLIFLALAFILAVSLVSAIFVKNSSIAMFGSGGEIDTFLSLLILAVGLFVVSLVFQSEKRILMFFLFLGCSSLVVFIYQALHSIFGLTFSPWSLLPRKIDTLVGSWNELAIFFGFIALEAVIFFEFFRISRFLRIGLLVLVGMSLLMMVIVNFTTAWIAFGIFLLVLLVYLYSTSMSSRNFARLPLFLILLVIFFIMARVLVGDWVNSWGLSSLEVRPSWTATFDVSQSVLKEGVKNVFLGSGPNTFLYDWLKFKPVDINKTVFWNTRFTSGIGLLPSFLATSGLLGIIGWLAFLALIAYKGFKTIVSSASDLIKYLLLATFLGMAYLWVFNIIYVPSNFLFALSFLVTGLFLAMLMKSGKIKVKEFSFVNKTSFGFLAALLAVFLMILGVAGFYLLFQKYYAAYNFSRGLVAFNIEGNLDKAEGNFARAVRFDNQDRYYNSLGEVGLLRLSQILNKPLTQEEMRSQFQNALAATIQNAQTATNLNPLEPLNWMLLGRIYESIMPFGIQGSREFALSSYAEALKRDPTDPVSLFSSARVEIQANDETSARTFLNSALNAKNDYTPALFLLAQLEAKQGNLVSAIQQTEQALLTAPNDIGVLFQLGLLYYNNKQYDAGRVVLERAVSLNPSYSNARYFLGLIYDRQGRKSDAIGQFEKIKELNPGNSEVETILANLKSGRSALSEISPPQPEPEKRAEPPVKEESSE